MSDIVRINGKVYTHSRAVALGLIRPATVPGLADVVVVPVVKKAGRPKGSKNIKARITGGATTSVAPKAASADIPVEAQVPVDAKPAKKIEPLKPQNVIKGVPIMDQETLDAIVERTASIEAARAAAEAAKTDKIAG